jgi:hypothetical protein
MLQQPVDGRDGRECLSRAGRHLDERAGAIIVEGYFQVLNCPDLTITQTRRVQRRDVVKPQSLWPGNPVGHGFGAMECEDFAGAWLWIATVREASDNAGALINEGQRLLAVNPFELRSSVPGGLVLHGRDLVAPVFGLGFNDADSLLFQEQNVIGRTYVSLVLANRDAGAGVEVQRIPVLNDPPCLDQFRIDLVASDLFGILVIARH